MVFTLGHGLFCAKCGAYSFSKTMRLAEQCPGRAVGAVRYRLRRMLSGKHPLSGAFLDAPAPVDDVARQFHVYLLGPGGGPPAEQEGPQEGQAASGGLFGGPQLG